MDHRGRSRDVSPVALARVSKEHGRHDSFHNASYSRDMSHQCISIPVVSQPHTSTSRLDSSPYSCPPGPSTSPNDSLLSRNNSSSTMDSFSSDPSVEPITPPDYSCHAPPTMSLDCYDSPPSLSQSLLDRMQLAYAHGDMHLARVLLLKMQGVDVDGDNDPRIAAVQEEDFTSYFVPEGSFKFEEADLRLFEEAERIERERSRRLARHERLKACGGLWEDSVQAVRYEKAKTERRREEEMIQRRRSEIEAREREKQRERERSREKEREMQKFLRPLRTTSGNPRALLSYESLLDRRIAKPSSPPEDLLRYPLPPSPPRVSSSYLRSSSLPKQDAFSLTRFKRELALQHSRSIARSVSFADVIVSMHGPLFPAANESSAGKPHKNRSSAQMELFQSMFQAETESREKKQVVAKGKELDAADTEQKSDTETRKQDPEGCVPESRSSQSSVKTVSDSTLSTSASTVRRTNSWFSFGSRKTTSTALTTPSTSLSSASVKSPPSSSATLPTIVVPSTVAPRICRPSLVPAIDDPLSPPPAPTSQSQLLEDPSDPSPSRGRPRTRGSHTHASYSDDTAIDSDSDLNRGLVRRVSRSVSNIIDLAAQFQRAYVKATLFSVGADMYAYASSSRSRSSSRGTSCSRSRAASPVRQTHHSLPPSKTRKDSLLPEGYRVHPSDVTIFVSPVSDDDPLNHLPQPTRTLISLISASEFQDLAVVRTYKRVFPLPPPIPRSPFRFPEPPPVQLPRQRPVANPVLLRLQALQNICSVRALQWEGKPREGKMCAGKERMTGIAWEGIGRSNLNWEVKPAPC